MTRHFLPTAVAFLIVAAHSATAHADLIISSLGATTTIDFESTLTGSNNGQFNGSGFDPGASAAGLLDSNSWKALGFSAGSMNFGDTQTSNDFARGTATGGVGTGGVYAFDASADGGSVGLGVQPGGSDFTPGSFTLRLQNDTGSEVTNFDLGYELRVYNDQARANSFNFQYSLDDSTYIDVGFFDVTSDEAAAGAPNWDLVFDNETNVGGFSLADGANIFFRWTSDDVSGSGARDQFHLDNIDITFNAAAVPEPGSLGLIAAALGGAFFMRRKKNKLALEKVEE